jgi:hypothetical protein
VRELLKIKRFSIDSSNILNYDAPKKRVYGRIYRKTFPLGD